MDYGLFLDPEISEVDSILKLTCDNKDLYYVIYDKKTDASNQKKFSFKVFLNTYLFLIDNIKISKAFVTRYFNWYDNDYSFLYMEYENIGENIIKANKLNGDVNSVTLDTALYYIQYGDIENLDIKLIFNNKYLYYNFIKNDFDIISGLLRYNNTLNVKTNFISVKIDEEKCKISDKKTFLFKTLLTPIIISGLRNMDYVPFNLNTDKYSRHLSETSLVLNVDDEEEGKYIISREDSLIIEDIVDMLKEACNKSNNYEKPLINEDNLYIKYNTKMRSYVSNTFINKLNNKFDSYINDYILQKTPMKEFLSYYRYRKIDLSYKALIAINSNVLKSDINLFKYSEFISHLNELNVVNYYINKILKNIIYSDRLSNGEYLNEKIYFNFKILTSVLSEIINQNFDNNFKLNHAIILRRPFNENSVSNTSSNYASAYSYTSVSKPRIGRCELYEDDILVYKNLIPIISILLIGNSKVYKVTFLSNLDPCLFRFTFSTYGLKYRQNTDLLKNRIMSCVFDDIFELDNDIVNNLDYEDFDKYILENCLNLHETNLIINEISPINKYYYKIDNRVYTTIYLDESLHILTTLQTAGTNI